MATSVHKPPPGSDVLVVGAGPVGLTAAHELARRGLRVRVVDAAPGPARTSRAVAVHPRTLETFDQMGTAEGMLRHGRRNRAFTMYATGRRLVRLEADYASMPTRYPYTLIIEQTRTEGVLRAALARLGVRVEWGVRLAGFEQDATGVRARLVHTDSTRDSTLTRDSTGAAEHEEREGRPAREGPRGREEREELRGRGELGESGEWEEVCAVPWLVGCDGGHSTVRKTLGLPLVGESRDTWMLADAPVRMDLAPDTIYWVHTGGQALMMVPYAREGHWRLLDTAPRSHDGRGSAERFGARLSRGLGTGVQVGEPEWTSVFTFQQRMVPRMHEGRVFVAGDAAHVHSPASGQGMNTGIQEAYNLAWKLAAVHHGHARRPLLESYGQERVPVGRALLDSTRTATWLVQFKNALAAIALPLVFAVVRNVPWLRRAIQRKVLGGMSGLRLHYAGSPLTTPAATPRTRRRPGPAPGERASAAATAGDALARELRDVRWSLLLAHDGSDRDDSGSDHGGDRDRGSDHDSDRDHDHGSGSAHGSSSGSSSGSGSVALRTAREAEGRYGAWLSVRRVGGRTGQTALPDAGGVLPDADGALRAALGLAAEGSWVLVRPDGYLAARGETLTPAVLERALAPVHPVAARDAAPLERPSGSRRAVQDTVETNSPAGATEMERTR
ncbi:FAD-dependent oxidoreductase [Streptomyces sp. NPDC006465]|uniref:FAD-dependent oxidoreductase n=1 Tax=Streptomyces sp. NPDC006465 TaxID=3157174 RepID=UPI0033A4258B